MNNIFWIKKNGVKFTKMTMVMSCLDLKDVIYKLKMCGESSMIKKMYATKKQL